MRIQCCLNVNIKYSMPFTIQNIMALICFHNPPSFPLSSLPHPSLSFSRFSFLLALTPYLSSSQDQSPVGVCFSSLSAGADTLHVSPGYDL